MDDPKEILREEVLKLLECKDDQAAKIKALVDGIRTKAEQKLPEVKEHLDELLTIVQKKSIGWRLKAKSHKDALDKFKESKAEFEEKALDEFASILTVTQRTKIILWKADQLKAAKDAGETGPVGKLVAAVKENEADLEITDKQKDELKEFMTKTRAGAEAKIAEVKPVMEELRKAHEANDEKKCEEQLKLIREWVRQARAGREVVVENLKKILEPEQMIKIMLIQMSHSEHLTK